LEKQFPAQFQEIGRARTAKVSGLAGLRFRKQIGALNQTFFDGCFFVPPPHPANAVKCGLSGL
jgi:hypothetical protein